MNKLMKQVQKMQSDMAKLQEELAERTTEGTAGGGMVTAMVNGKNELLELKINPEVVDPEEIDMLQDLIIAAVNDALRRSQEMVSEEMAKISGGMKIPGLF
ncbi:MAG: YbaB/EbfC family nucleoid-associated protein [Bacillota bacterium]